VTTPIGTEGISTISGKNILIADNVNEFISHVERLISDHNLFNSIGVNAIEYIHEKFDNLTLANSLIDFYKQHI
jgi:hypothetical protein